MELRSSVSVASLFIRFVHLDFLIRIVTKIYAVFLQNAGIYTTDFGSHSGDYEEYSPMGCNAMQFRE
jgi:hypothetical protein